MSASARREDLEKTISPDTVPIPPANAQEVPQTVLAGGSTPSGSFVPASRKAFPAGESAVVAAPAVEVQSGTSPPIAEATVIENRLNVAAPTRTRSGIERTMTRFFLFVLLLGVIAAAFYGGRRYKGPIPYLDQNDASVAQPSPLLAGAPVVGDDPLLKFERSRREVDNDPNAWLTTQLKNEMSRQGIQNPLDSTDAEFLYLYGRALLLVGNNDEAVRAFEAAIARANLVSPQQNATLKKEAAIGLAAIALKSDKDKPAALAHFDEVMRTPASSPSPSGSPLLSP
jgi:hypothetical protein